MQASLITTLIFCPNGKVKALSKEFMNVNWPKLKGVNLFKIQLIGSCDRGSSRRFPFPELSSAVLFRQASRDFFFVLIGRSAREMIVENV
jgi:hypothetical protein